MGDVAGGANPKLPVFKEGGNAAGVLSASYQNHLARSVERLSQMTFGTGQDTVEFGPMRLRKRQRQPLMVHVVKVPDDGIPAMRDMGGYWLPGMAACELYRMSDSESLSETIHIEELDITIERSVLKEDHSIAHDDGAVEPTWIIVHNTSTSEIPASQQFVQIHMEASGYWLAIAGGGGGGGATIGFSITDVDCSEVNDCGFTFATATVTYTSCGMSSPKVGDEVTVIDAAGCFLEGPSELLLGRNGQAFKAELGDCNPYEPGCEWVIQMLCNADLSC